MGKLMDERRVRRPFPPLRTRKRCHLAINISPIARKIVSPLCKKRLEIDDRSSHKTLCWRRRQKTEGRFRREDWRQPSVAKSYVLCSIRVLHFSLESFGRCAVSLIFLAFQEPHMEMDRFWGKLGRRQSHQCIGGYYFFFFSPATNG